ncbi:MAG: MbtH family NRPS accessory protein [Chromatiaceae bacterium]|nr:MbtH family NRPS accessory protein [Chromatiaceae bacterium]
MASEENTNGKRYKVVLNAEGQFSIWLADRDVPLGWESEGTVGTKQECWERISKQWTDMRPLSLRNKDSK